MEMIDFRQGLETALPMSNFEQVPDQVERLSPDNQLRLMERIAAALRQRMPAGKTRRITELKGLGKEIWQDIDVQKYVDEERDSWNG